MIQATPAYGASIYSALSTQYGKSAPTDNSAQNTSFSLSQQQTAEDTVTLSRQGIQQATSVRQSDQQESENKSQVNEPTGKDGKVLTQQEQQQLQKLKLRDTEVKAHEQAHLSIAGQYAAGGASFSFETGPDGVKYAVGGEVPIDIGKEDTPEATILKMQTVKRAALAPASPSSADRMIAAQADQKAAQARQELMQEQNSNAQELFANDSTNSFSEQSAGNSDTESTIGAAEGSSRKTLAINAYQQIASMTQ